MTSPRRADDGTSIELRDSLDRALTELESGGLAGATVAVFSRRWWDAQPRATKEALQKRAASVGIRLRADTRISGHLVEVRMNDAGGLSSEQPI